MPEGISDEDLDKAMRAMDADGSGEVGRRALDAQAHIITLFEYYSTIDTVCFVGLPSLRFPS